MQEGSLRPLMRNQSFSLNETVEARTPLLGEEEEGEGRGVKESGGQREPRVSQLPDAADGVQCATGHESNTSHKLAAIQDAAAASSLSTTSRASPAVHKGTGLRDAAHSRPTRSPAASLAPPWRGRAGGHAPPQPPPLTRPHRVARRPPPATAG